MLWLKAFHVIAVIAWFAGLFYLPRLYVYHADARDPISIERFKVMERRLFAIMTLGAAAGLLLGATMVVAAPLYLAMQWLRIKLAAGAVGDRVSRRIATSSCAILRRIATVTAPSGTAPSTRCPRCC